MTVVTLDDDRRRVAGAQDRFMRVIEDLSDAAAHRASLLPTWTVGHVLTHVARNADSHRRRADAAMRGEMVDQYPGGYRARACEIDAGANRPAHELVDDVRTSAAAMDAAWRQVPEGAWSGVTRDVSGRERPLRALPARRWQELEVHLVDLDLGVTYRDWTVEFVDVWLPPLRATIESRLPAGAPAPDAGVLDERAELAWLYGRLQPPDVPALSPWG